MNNARILHKAFGFATNTIGRRAHRSYGVLTPKRESPFLKLLSWHQDRPSVRHSILRRRHYSSQSEVKPHSPTNTAAETNPNRSLSQRLKDLSRKYGWVALGTYVGLTILDMPFFFLAVRSIGTERIGHYEHAAVQWIKSVLPYELPQIKLPQIELPQIRWPWQTQPVDGPKEQETVHGNQGPRAEGDSQSSANGEEASMCQTLPAEIRLTSLLGLWTQILIAYALHKSFIFLRIPLTIAITPKVAKTLRSWAGTWASRHQK